MKGDKMARRSSFGNMMRKKLSDITNSLPRPKSPVIPDKLPPDAVSAKEYLDHLVKEKMSLVKLIQEKNKILELSGIEIQNLRTNLQKMQLQNWNLAQSNSQMLAELNLGKDKLKAMQHELGCKVALLKTKKFELKGQEVEVQKNELQEPETLAMESGSDKDSRPCNANRRRSSRSRSLGSSIVSQQHAEKEAVGSKRRCLRRQSATSSRIQQQEPTENLFEIDDVKFPIAMPSSTPIHEVESTKKEVMDGSCDSKFGDEESRRVSFVRPLRRAAEKVHSYKENRINIKMRRPE